MYCKLIETLFMQDQASLTTVDVQHFLQTHLPEFKDKKLTLETMFGLTNQTFKVSAESLSPVILQIYSPTLTRKQTLEIIKRIESQEICPKFLFTCEKYRIEEFIQEVDHMYSEDLLGNPKLLEKLFIKLHKLHQVQLPKDLQRSHLYDVLFDEERNRQRLNASCP